MSIEQPADPLGTVRRHPLGHAVAVRGFSNESDDHIWYVIDTSGHGMDEMPDLTSWPIALHHSPTSTEVDLSATFDLLRAHRAKLMEGRP